MSQHPTPRNGLTRRFLIPWLTRLIAMSLSVVLGLTVVSLGGRHTTPIVQPDPREMSTIEVYSQPYEPHYGDTITLGAWITCGQDQPTGHLTFRDGDNLLAVLDVTETSVEYSAGKLPSGSHDIRAEYSGDARCAAVSGHTDLIIGGGTLTLGSSKNPSQVGDNVIFTASTGGCPGNVTFTIDGSPVATVALAAGSATYSTSSLAAGSHNIAVSYNGNCGPIPSAGLIQSVGAAAGVAGTQVCLFGDGRVNCRAEDAAQTVAVYCTAGGVTLWSVPDGTGSGTFAFAVSAAELNAVPQNPPENTLIKAAGGISLYRLKGGKLQVNGPKGYVFTWDGC